MLLQKKCSLFLFSVALVLNFLFFKYLSDDSFCRGMVGVHGEIAYNIYHSNVLAFNKEREQYIRTLEQKYDRRVHYSEIDHSLFLSSPLTPFKSTTNTPFYGLALGLLWKISHSLSYNDIIILQILLYSLCLLLLFRIVLLFFSFSVAVWVACAHLSFFPLLYLNVYPLRDIWIYYGLIVMFYGITTYIKNVHSLKILAMCSLFFSVCQLMRPPLFASFIALLTVCFLGMMLKFIKPPAGTSLLLVMIGTNIIGFWIPFARYNIKMYDRIMVSSHGHACLAGLGELPNKWGYQMSDPWFDGYMKEHFNLQVDTPECNEKALHIFFNSIIEEPWFYLKILIHRLPNLLLPGLVWFSYVPHFEYASIKQKINAAFHSPHALADVVGRQLYVRLYLLLGYLGLILLLWRRYYFLVALFFLGIMASSWWMILVHLEHRYLIPYYTFFSLPVGCVMAEIGYIWNFAKRYFALLFNFSFLKG